MQEDYENNKAAIQAEADRRVKEAESKNKGFWESVGDGFEDAGKAIGDGFEDVGKAIGGVAEDVGKAIGSGLEDVGDFAEKSWKSLF